MTFYHVAVHHLVHTCPANRELHIWATSREVLGILEGGSCEDPKTIGSGDSEVTIACGRFLPAHKRCRACRVTVVEASVTVTQTGAVK